MARII